MLYVIQPFGCSTNKRLLLLLLLFFFAFSHTPFCTVRPWRPQG